MADNDSDKLALVPARRRELAQTLVDAINAKHAEAVEASRDVENATDRLHSLTSEVGVLIIEAQATFKTRFDDLVGRYLGFHRPALRSYCVIAQKQRPAPDFRSKWHDLKTAAQPVGLIPFAEGHGEQTRHAVNFFSISTRQLLAFVGGFRKHVRVNPLEQWSEETLEQFAAQMKPAVDVYSQITRRLAAIRK